MMDTIKPHQMEYSNGMRVIAILNLIVTLIAVPVIWLLGMMVTSGNPAYETSFNIAGFGGLYAVVAVIVGMTRVWGGKGDKKWTLFLLLGWLFVAIAFVVTMIITDMVTS